MNLNFLKTQFFLITALAVASASTASAQTYQVTIQNLTQSQVFNEIFTKVHGSQEHIFQTGSLLSDSIASLFFPNTIFPAVIKAPHLNLVPGGSVSFEVSGRRRQKFFSLFSTLHATDDGFVGIDSVRLPSKRNPVITVEANAYDAGLFDNTESCDATTSLTSLNPPEECSQELKEVILQPKKPVVVHNGIHGVGDLSPAQYDWKNPVAQITIKIKRNPKGK